MIFADMHCDTISALLGKERQDGGKKEGLRENSLHIDLKRLKEADYMLQNFALFVGLDSCDDPLLEVMLLADLYYREMDANRDWIRPALSFDDIEKNRENGWISAVLTVEEGGVCKGEPGILRDLYRLGVRMMTLTWNYRNEIGFPNNARRRRGSTEAALVTLADEHRPDTENGLTETGFLFVEEMERLGMIVDVSHLSDAGFYDVARIAGKPFVASHSNARSVCGHVRNLTDDMIRVLAEKGGVTGLNFCPEFLSEDEEQKSGTIRSVVEHARHIVNVGGIECLGLGTDFDGIETHRELYDASCMPRLEAALSKEGFTASQMDKILHGNVLRLYRDCFNH